MCVESRYADQLKKVIVKIMVDKEFVNKGWLGMLSAGTLYVKFHDGKFDDKMLELVNELRRLLQLQLEG